MTPLWKKVKHIVAIISGLIKNETIIYSILKVEFVLITDVIKFGIIGTVINYTNVLVNIIVTCICLRPWKNILYF